MAKVEIEVTEKVKKTVELEFPAYKKAGDVHDTGGSWDSVSCLQKDGTELEVTHTEYRGQHEYQFESSKIDSRDYAAYAGLSEYSTVATKEDFDTMLREAATFLVTFGLPRL